MHTYCIHTHICTYIHTLLLFIIIIVVVCIVVAVVVFAVIIILIIIVVVVVVVVVIVIDVDIVVVVVIIIYLLLLIIYTRYLDTACVHSRPPVRCSASLQCEYVLSASAKTRCPGVASS